MKSAKGIDKKLDDAWSELIKARAGYKCAYCGSEGRLNSHHIYSRSNRSVRWDVNNGICLCVTHHTFGNFSAHKSPLDFDDWLRDYKGNATIDKLRLKSNQIAKYSKEDKEKMLKELKERINEYSI